MEGLRARAEKRTTAAATVAAAQASTLGRPWSCVRRCVRVFRGGGRASRAGCVGPTVLARPVVGRGLAAQVLTDFLLCGMRFFL